MKKAKNKKSIKNVNQLAVAISKIEGQKVNLSIAQIKEVIRCLALVIKEDDLALYIFLKYSSKA